MVIKMTTTIKSPGVDVYNQVKKLESDGKKEAAAASSSASETKSPFVNYLEDTVKTSRHSDAITEKSIDGKASSLEVMRATTAAETRIAEFMQVWNRLTQVIQDLERKNV